MSCEAHNQNFQQIWEFRRGDDDIYSSSDDSKSSSTGEPVVKKHKLVSNLILPENDEISDTPGYHQNDQLEPGEGVYFETGKFSNKGVRSTRKRRGTKGDTKTGSVKEGSNKKRKFSTLDPVSLDDLKIFTESLLQDLKLERENMFARLREDMRKLAAVKSIKSPTRKKGRCMSKTGKARNQKSAESGMKSQKFNDGPIESFIISSRMTDSSSCSKALEEQVNHDQAVQVIRSCEKDNGENMRLSANKSVYSSNDSDQLVSSSYLTLPYVLSEPQLEQHRIDSSSRKCVQPGVARNDTSLNFGRENLMIDANNHHGYFSGIQAEEPYTSFAQVGSKSIGGYDHNITQISNMGSGFPISFHQWLDNTSNISSQTVLENPSRGYNILGPRMNGAANNFHSHPTYKTNGGLAGFGTQNLKDSNFY